MAETAVLNGKEITLRRCPGDVCVITFYADFDIQDLDALFDSLPDVSICAVKIDDWNSELSPWYSPGVMGNGDFGYGARDLLGFIEGPLMKFIGCARYVIGGYSLAGLFSLWACYESDAFCGCAASSPSVWFDGWRDYIAGRRINAERVYLSLGDRENRTGNQRMKAVADNMVFQRDCIAGYADCTLEWNRGGHFCNVTERKARSFLSVLNGL